MLKKLYSIFYKIKILIYRIGLLKPDLLNYENHELNLYILNKTKKNCKLVNIEDLKINEQRSLNFSLIVKNKNFFNILDLGGGAGYHYFLAKKFLGKKYKLTWNIVENQTMVNLCKKKYNNKEMHFFNSISEIKNKIDIVFSSCAINYFNNPEEILYDLMRMPCKYYYFTRTPLALKKKIEFVQYSRLSENGPGNLFIKKEKILKLHNKIFKKEYFDNIIKKYCNILYSFKDEEQKLFYKKKINLYTYFLKKK